MTSAPPLSIVMPVYNARQYLAAALQSVLAQAFSDFELITIDDGSTDNSLAILQDFANHDPRIRIVSRPNKGITRTLNEGVELARAPLIARMDADDICLPNRLDLQMKRFAQEPDLVLLGAGYELIDSAGRLLTIRRPPADEATLNQMLLEGRNPFCHPTTMMRTEALRRINAYDPATELAEDLDLFLRLSEIGKVTCLPDIVLRYRLHAGSLSEKKQHAQVAMLKRVCESAWERRGLAKRELNQSISWRPTSGRESAQQFALQYGWWAFNSAQRRTAMIYGLKAIGALPFSSKGWRLLACAMLKPMPAPKELSSG